MDSRKINLVWARRNIPSFKKYEGMVNQVKADEEKYKQQPGYLPYARDR